MARKAGMATGVTVARINVKVSPDTKEFRRDLKAELEEIERTLKGDVHIKAHLDGAQAKADFERLKNAMNKSRVKVGVDMVPGSAGGGGASSDDDVDKQTKKAGKFLGMVNELTAGIKFPSFGTGINFAGYAVILAAITAVAAPLIGIITGAMLALPGLLTAVLAPIGAVTLGMKGIADAAAEAGLTNRETGKKGKVKTTVGDALKSLQDDVAKTFKADFVPVFEKLIGLIEDPRLHTAFQAVAHGVGNMAEGFVQAITSVPGMSKLTDAIKNIGDGLSQMRPGIGSFTDGFLTLIDEFTKKMPDIATWFNKAGKGFSDELTRMANSGELSRIFDGVGQSIKTVLDMLVEMGKTGLNFMSDPAKVQGFLDVLRQVAGVLEGIVRMSDRMGKVWSWNPGTWVDRALRAVGANDGYVAPGEIGIMDSLDAAMGGGSGGSGTAGMTEAEIATARLNKALENTQFKAQQAGESLSTLWGTNAAPAKVQGPGFNNDYPLGGGPAGGEAAKPKVPAPDTSEAEAKLKGYQDVANNTMTAAKKSIEEATTNAKVNPPNLEGFNTALDGLGDTASRAMDTVVSEIQAAGGEAGTAAQAVGQQAADAMKGMEAQFQTVGFQMMNGVATGISEGRSLAIGAAVNAAVAAYEAAKNALGIKSPSRKFMELGDYSMQGLGKGMENGVQPVLDQAKDIAGKISDAFADGSDPTSILDGFTAKEESNMEKVLGWQSKRLGAQAAALERKARLTKDQGFKAQADAVRLQKEEIDDQKSMLDLAAEFADLQNEGKDEWKGPIAKALNGMAQMPFDFLGATGGQFLNDIGISGGGAMGAVMDYGKQMANNYVFNVGNMEDALTAHQNMMSKQAIGMVGR